MSIEVPSALLESLTNPSLGCVLFVGAGMSTYAYGPDGIPSPMPTGRVLAERLCDALKIRYAGQPLSEVAEYYELASSGSRARLVRWLAGELRDAERRPGPVHVAYAGLPFKAHITTNYDTLIERSLREVKDQYTIVHADEKIPPETLDIHPHVYKIMGDIQRPETIIITDEDYEGAYATRNSGTVHKVSQLMEENSVLFVGYSLSDRMMRDEIQRVVKIHKRFSRPTFAVVPDADGIVQQYWRREHRSVNILRCRGDQFLCALLRELKMDVTIELVLDRIARSEKRALEDVRETIAAQGRQWGRSLSVSAKLYCEQNGVDIDGLTV